jgi:ribosome biogenesis GTPase A
MKENSFNTTFEIENAMMTGSSRFLPPAAARAIRESQIRVKILTHADRLSDAALIHQIQLAREECGSANVAIFAVQFPETLKLKDTRTLWEAVIGATFFDKKALVCGIPNSGKSTFIYTLQAEIEPRKKYQPRISPKAGRTLKVKQHWIKSIDKQKTKRICLYDTPGLRLRLDDITVKEGLIDREVISLLSAARVIEATKDVSDYVQYTPVKNILHALNRYALINKETPKYVKKLKLDGPIEESKLFMEALCNVLKRKLIPLTEIIRMSQVGRFGGMVFGSEPIRTDLPMLRLNRGTNAIVYMNEEAQMLQRKGAELRKLKKKS